MNKNLAIIGAGASGLLLSKKLSRHADVQVYLFEKCKHVGTKLRASGGGKANIFNTHITPSCYNDPEFMAQFLQQISPEELKFEFEQMGLRMVADDEGRVYPYSQFSQTMVDLLWTPDAKNIHTELEYEVRRLKKVNERWQINDYPVLFDTVVLASGSPANMIPANRKAYNGFLTDLNVQCHPFEPSLVGFKIKNYPKQLSGCRVKVVAALYQHDRLIYSEPGEVTFKDDGLSGIVILNLSAYYSRLKERSRCHMELNFLYADNDYDVDDHLKKYGSLKGILHPKLHALYEHSPFNVKKFKLEIEERYDLAFAQVCHGGIDLREVDDQLALKRFPNVYVMGEMLNIDGVCGGYNLFFAFASALVVANAFVKS